MEVVSDSSPLIALGKLNALFLFEKLYEKVVIVHAVYEEVVIKGLEESCKDAFQVAKLIESGIIVVEKVKGDKELLNEKLGKGETETIILASREKSDLVLIDDLLARTEARKKNLRVKGTIGVLYEAHKRHLLEWDKFQELIQEIISRNDIWIHEDLCKSVLKEAKHRKVIEKP